MYISKNLPGQITNNRHEEVYRKLYNSNDRQTEDTDMQTINILVLCINTTEIKKTLQGMNKR